MSARTEVQPASLNLRVPALAASLGFYRDLLGLESPEMSDEASHYPAASALLCSAGASAPLLRLREVPDAPPSPPRSAGLFHLALRVPRRRDLARVFVGLRSAGYPLQGASDHGVSEALYMGDPHGNGVEIYADRPRETWQWAGGEIRMFTRSLDLESLLADLEDDDGAAGGGGPLLPPGTDLGHVHLRVTDLDRTEAFYSGVLGLDVTTRSYPGARFFSSGGYHHHLGANVWGTGGGDPFPEGALGLGRIDLVTPQAERHEETLRRARAEGYRASAEGDALILRDPDGIPVRLRLRR